MDSISKNQLFACQKILLFFLNQRLEQYIKFINNTFANQIVVSFIARSGFPETITLLGFREIVPHSRNNKFWHWRRYCINRCILFRFNTVSFPRRLESRILRSVLTLILGSPKPVVILRMLSLAGIVLNTITTFTGLPDS